MRTVQRHEGDRTELVAPTLRGMELHPLDAGVFKVYIGLFSGGRGANSFCTARARAQQSPALECTIAWERRARRLVAVGAGCS